MVKKTINLLPKKEELPPFWQKIKKILLYFSGVLFFSFLFAFFLSFSFLNRRLAEFNSAKRELILLEQKLSDFHQKEAIYSSSEEILRVLERILAEKTNFFPLLAEINSLSLEGVNILLTNVDYLGNVSLNLTASSATSLDNFVKKISAKEEKGKIFSQIVTSGIVRDKEGKYNFSISFKAAKEFFR